MTIRLAERLIAFLDILGFSQRLKEDPLESLHERYSLLIDEANKKVFSPPSISEHNLGTLLPNFDYAGFHSDSVVLVSKDLTGERAPEGAFSFVAAIAVLLEEGFAHRFPFRGCIGFGNVLLDEERRILLSDVLPALLSMEKLQEWSGCVIHPDVESRVLALLFGCEPPVNRASLLVRHRVLLKQQQVIEHGLCVNWVSVIAAHALANGLDFLIGQKRYNTHEFVQYVQGLPDTVYPLKIPGTAIVAIRVVPALGGLRFKFMDENGEGVDPPDGFKVEFRIQIPLQGKVP
jgi:hypothetical protein